MDDDIINQAIEEVAAESQEEANTPEPIEQEEEATETEVVNEEQESTEETQVETPFPKKAVNALARRDKKISKLQAEYAAAQSEIQTFREQAQTTQSENVPTEEQFDNYGDYLKAVAKHEFEQEATQKNEEQLQAQQAEKEQAYVAERETYATDKAREAIDKIPEYKELFLEHADVLQSFPPHLERAFLEADEPGLAFYALAKEGSLEGLMNMSPARAAMEIGKAEVRGAALSQKKQITNAPAPLQKLKGAGKVGKSPDTMSSDELLKWANN